MFFLPDGEIGSHDGKRARKFCTLKARNYVPGEAGNGEKERSTRKIPMEDESAVSGCETRGSLRRTLIYIVPDLLVSTSTGFSKAYVASIPEIPIRNFLGIRSLS